MSQFYVWPRLGVTHPQWTCLDGVANGQGLEAAAAPREECIISPENLERLIAIHTTTAGTPPQTLETPQSPPVDMDAVADATAADFKARALAAEYQDAHFIVLCWRCACRPWHCACRPLTVAVQQQPPPPPPPVIAPSHVAVPPAPRHQQQTPPPDTTTITWRCVVVPPPPRPATVAFAAAAKPCVVPAVPQAKWGVCPKPHVVPACFHVSTRPSSPY
jgi:hypothetical protein